MHHIHTFIHRLHNPDLGILLLRIALGVVFINAGWLKVSDMNVVLGFFNDMGIPSFLGYIVSYAEFIGGMMLLLGVFVRYVGIILAVVMLVASKILFDNGFSLASGGYEYTFVLMLASFAMATFGAGKYSLAHSLKR